MRHEPLTLVIGSGTKVAESVAAFGIVAIGKVGILIVP